MPPKKDGGKAKKKGSDGQINDGMPGWIATADSKHTVALQQALEAMRADPIFQDNFNKMPLSLDDGGNIAPWTSDAWAKKKATTKKLKAGANALWAAPFKTACPGVPTNLGQVNRIKATKSPLRRCNVSDIGFSLHFALDSPDYDITQHFGDLMNLSPNEYFDAALLTVFELLKMERTSLVTQALQEWAHALMSVEAVFEVLPPGPERFYAAKRLRNKFEENHQETKRSARQECYEINAFRATMDDKMSDTKFAEVLAKNIPLVPGRDPYTKTFVETCVKIFKRVLSNSLAQQILSDFDAVMLDVSPWTSNYSLLAVAERIDDPQNIGLVFEQSYDAYMQGYLTQCDFSVKQLRDQHNSCVSVLCLIVEMRFFLLGRSFLGSLDHVSEKNANYIRMYLDRPPHFRKNHTPYRRKRLVEKGIWIEETSNPDLTRFAGWNEQEVAFLDVLETFCYTDRFFGLYRTAVKSSKTIHDFLEYPSVAERLKGVREAKAIDKVSDNANSENDNALETATSISPLKKAGGSNTVDTIPQSHASSEMKQFGHEHLSMEDHVYWNDFAERTMRRTNRFFVKPKAMVHLVEMVKEMKPRMHSNPLGLTLINHNVMTGRECKTRPDLRSGTIAPKEFFRIHRAIIEGRWESKLPDKKPHLMPGDVACCIDGGKDIKRILEAPFKIGTVADETKDQKVAVLTEAQDDDEDVEDENQSLAVEELEGEISGFENAEVIEVGPDAPRLPQLLHTKVQLGFTQSSLAARRKLCRSVGSLKQLVGMHLWTCNKLRLPERARCNGYEGSNLGDLISGVALPDIDRQTSSEWFLDVSEKKEAYGKDMVAVGGKTEGGDGTPLMSKDNFVPFSYWNLPPGVLECVCKGMYVRNIIDATPDVGHLSFVATLNGWMYLGICMTEKHKELLEKNTTKRILQAMRNKDGPLFNPRYGNAHSSADHADVDSPARSKRAFPKTTKGQGAKKRIKTADAGPAVKDKLRASKAEMKDEEASEVDEEDDSDEDRPDNASEEWDPLA